MLTKLKLFKYGQYVLNIIVLVIVFLHKIFLPFVKLGDDKNSDENKKRKRVVVVGSQPASVK